MRKLVITAAALLMCAGPAAAQQLQRHEAATPLAAAQAPEPKAPREPREVTLYPSTDQVKADVRTNEERMGHAAPMGSRDWWYLVAAVAVGVIIAALVL